MKKAFFIIVSLGALMVIQQGCTSKSVEQGDKIIEERIHGALQHIVDNPPKPEEYSLYIHMDSYTDYSLACLYMNQQVDRANELINDYCKEHPIEPIAYPAPYPRGLFRLYLMPQCHKHLTDVTRHNIEKLAWNWIYARSQIDPSASSWNNASRGVWHITGSENHDANGKACSLLAAQILRQADAPYGPKAKLADGRTVQEHYQAWEGYWKEYFRQRAREGLNCEIASPYGYGMATIGSWYDAAELGGSASLKKIGQDCLNLFWARVACDFEPRSGIRAAFACTRGYDYICTELGSTYWARSLLNIYGLHDNDTEPSLPLLGLKFYTSSYRVPDIVRAIARDTNRGTYLAAARHFGRGGEWVSQPSEFWGVYEVVFDKGHNSSLLRTVYYTPDYTLAALTFDPAKSYIELARQSRVLGVTFSNNVDDRVMVYGFGGKHAHDTTDWAQMYQVTSCTINGVCGAECMIVARDPGADLKDGIRIFISQGDLWDNRTEDQDGWLFTRAGNAYCGIRIAAGDYTVKPSPFKTGYYLELEDTWTPVLIQMGRMADQKSFAAFKDEVMAANYTYDQGKLDYVSLAGDKYEYWSNSTTLPKINGAEVNINPANTYDYPYLKMEHGSDVATISYPGFDDLILNFAY